MAVELFAVGRVAESFDRFEEVLAEPPSGWSAGVFERYPLPVPFNVAGVDSAIPMGRDVARIYAAVICQMNGDSEQAMQALELAEPSELVTALKSTLRLTSSATPRCCGSPRRYPIPRNAVRGIGIDLSWLRHPGDG
jgi:hypothetical protein